MIDDEELNVAREYNIKKSQIPISLDMMGIDNKYDTISQKNGKLLRYMSENKIIAKEILSPTCERNPLVNLTAKYDKGLSKRLEGRDYEDSVQILKSHVTKDPLYEIMLNIRDYKIQDDATQEIVQAFEKNNQNKLKEILDKYKITKDAHGKIFETQNYYEKRSDVPHLSRRETLNWSKKTKSQKFEELSKLAGSKNALVKNHPEIYIYLKKGKITNNFYEFKNYLKIRSFWYTTVPTVIVSGAVHDFFGESALISLGILVTGVFAGCKVAKYFKSKRD